MRTETKYYKALPSRKSITFGLLVTFIFPPALVVEHFKIFLALSLFQFCLLGLLFFLPALTMSIHISLFMILLSYNLLQTLKD